MIKGKIIKGIGGFYYVETADSVVYECKLRGIFRQKKITPVVGDNVMITIGDNSQNIVDEILERKNLLNRPPLANIDTLFILSSLKDPSVNTYNIDKLTAIAEKKSIDCVIVFTKTDLSDESEKYVSIYENAGFKTVLCNNNTGEGAGEIANLIKNKVCAFTGNSGVGKSSLINNIDKSLNLETGITSKKLGRGKHTTRHSELFHLCGGYVADTPGFSSIDFEKSEIITKDELQYCFKEFNDYIGKCKFIGCAHVKDKGCQICKAVDDGIISVSRHNSYVQMYNEVKDIKEWQLK